MTQITIDVPGPLLSRLALISATLGSTTENTILSKWKGIENMTHQEFMEELGRMKQLIIDRDTEKFWNLHPMQSYVIWRSKDEKTWREISFRGQPERDHSQSSLREYVGKYVIEIRTVTAKGGMGIFPVITKRKILSYRSLKLMKKRVNKIFQEHGYGPHYKERRK